MGEFQAIFGQLLIPENITFSKSTTERLEKGVNYIGKLTIKTTELCVHQTLTCSKSTIETTEKGVKYVRS